MRMEVTVDMTLSIGIGKKELVAIEVKSTQSVSGRYEFEIMANEWAAAERHGQNYILVTVCDVFNNPLLGKVH